MKSTEENNRLVNLLEDLFITAFEGGSSYWAEVKDPTPSGVGSPSERWFNHIKNGGSMDVYDVENEDELLGTGTWESMEWAIPMMKEDFAHMTLEEADADIADVWFQFASIGKYTYG